MSSREPCVLVVDDDRDLCDSVVEALGDQGYSAVAKSDGASAIEYLKTHSSIGLILLDWHMAPMNGPELIEALEQASIPIPAVVLFTADSTQPTPAALRAVGQLTKPVNLPALYRFAQTYCGRSTRGVSQARG